MDPAAIDETCRGEDHKTTSVRCLSTEEAPMLDNVTG